MQSDESIRSEMLTWQKLRDIQLIEYVTNGLLTKRVINKVITEYKTNMNLIVKSVIPAFINGYKLDCFESSWESFAGP